MLQYFWQHTVGGLMSYLRYLCLFAYSGVQHILCCVFGFISCVPYICCHFSGLSIFYCPFGILEYWLYCKRGQNSEISHICKVHVYRTFIFHHFWCVFSLNWLVKSFVGMATDFCHLVLWY